MQEVGNSSVLVSIVVITYNSSKYVLETLESIKEQTYSNIELIISDDCSQDDTVDICSNWLHYNSDRFVRIELLTTDVNKGVSANCNRGFAKAQGDWIKCIAGDDCLFPNCIEKNVAFISKNEGVEICHSKMQLFSDNVEQQLLQQKEFLFPVTFRGNNLNGRKQFYSLCLCNVIGAASVFISRQLFTKMGGFDEEIPMCEDWPMWLKITQSGYVFHYLDDYTVKYRIHADSIFGKESVGVLFSTFFSQDILVHKKYIITAPWLIRWIHMYDFRVRQLLAFYGLNRQTHFCRLLYGFLSLPFRITYKIFR